MESLDTWLAVFTLVALAYYVLPQRIRAGVVAAGRAVLGMVWSVAHQVTSKRSARSGVEHLPALSTPVSSTNQSARRPARRRSVQAFKWRSSVQNDAGLRSAQPAAESGGVQRSAFSVPCSADPSSSLERPASIQELQQLGEAIRLKVSGRTKQEAVEAAFGVRKGAGDGWKRASWLYDQAMSGERGSGRGAVRAREVDTA